MSRIRQLDNSLLENELVSVLQDPLSKAFALLGRGNKHVNELTLLFRILLHRSSSKGYIFVSSILPYISSTLTTYALSHQWPDLPAHSKRRKLWTLLSHFETCYSSLHLLHFLLFLYNGKYPFISDRFRRRVGAAGGAGQVSYEYMNRTMVWNSFIEFLVFIIPLVPKRFLISPSLKPTYTTQEVEEGICGICNKEIEIRYRTEECGHEFCYYCISTVLLAEEDNEGGKCGRCGEKVTAVYRVEEEEEALDGNEST